MKMNDILREAATRKASDVLISAGSPVTYHVYGVLEHDSPQPLSAEDTKKLVYEILTVEERERLETENELDMGYMIEGVSRFRVNAYHQRGTIAAVLRVVPLTVPHYSEIGLTERLINQLVGIPNGLILITGPTGAGKSTTVASFLQYLNEEHGVAKHIVTIEDPIEFYFPPKDCVIDQREVGSDTANYIIGLRSALRQMPHVIFVGEMRDRETIEIALTAAETGNIVISTLSTQSAAKTINRIIDVFPPAEQNEIRSRLALTLRASISQVLLRRRDIAGRIAAREILLVNKAVSNLIRENKVHQIDNVISSSFNEGMVLLDDTLLALYQEGIVNAADIMPRLQQPEKAQAMSAV